MRRIVDLTLPIEEHWRYGIHFQQVKSIDKGDGWQARAYNLESHWFTHIDAPLHFVKNGRTLSDYPIEDWCITKCLVLDFSDIGDNVGIDADMLEKANAKYKGQHFDSLILRTDRGRKVSWRDTKFWDDSPYVTESGGIWIRDYAPKVVGYDFAQDYDIRKIRTAKPGDVIWQPVHEHVLVEGQILQIEYMTNLWNIKSDTCTLVALPLNTQNADGSQTRVVAVVDD